MEEGDSLPMLRRDAPFVMAATVRIQSVTYIQVLSVKQYTGHEYPVRETDCMAFGDEYCRFEIGEVIA